MSAIQIRPYELDDVEALYAAARESIAEVHPWLPWCHPRYARSDASAWVALQVEAWAARSEFQFVIVSDDGQFFGGCGINAINAEYKFANLGYWVRTSTAGRGVATEATKLVRDWAFANTDLLRLEIVVALGNQASARVAEKAGAVFEGNLRRRLFVHGRSHDVAMFSFVRGA